MPEPKYVITLVHGTFAPDAAWTKEESDLRKLIAKGLNTEVVFDVFGWSGANSHQVRTDAGTELRTQLGRCFEKYSQSQHFVIAHSHGGNIFLYALRNMLTATRLSGVITSRDCPTHLSRIGRSSANARMGVFKGKKAANYNGS